LTQKTTAVLVAEVIRFSFHCCLLSLSELEVGW